MNLALVGALIAAVLSFASTMPVADAAATTIVTCDDTEQVTPPQEPSLQSYSSITPERIVDTRDGLGGYSGLVAARCTLRLQLADSIVPIDAGAVALSLTAVSDERGFMTVFPCSDGRPRSSNMNTRADAPTANLVVAVPDENREVCIYTVLASHIVVDVQGWWGDGPNRFRPIEPDRAYDTRELATPAPLGALATRNVSVAGTFVPSNATSVVINLTATQTAAPGWMVAFPCGETPPLASNLNYATGDTRAVAAIVGVGTRSGGVGDICITTSADADFIVDVVGYYAPAPAFGPTIEMIPAQQRLVDTREASSLWNTPFAAGEIRSFDPTAGLDRAADVTAVVINAIGLGAARQGHLTFFPCADTPPTVSTLNTFPDSEVSNLLTVQLDDDGLLCVLSFSAGDVVLDLVGVQVVTKGSALRDLDIAGVEVWPEFTPQGRDYALECVAGTNPVTYSLTPHRNSTASIDGAPAGPGVAAALQLSADDITTIAVATPGEPVATYSFRCLPADFPRLTIDRPGEPTPGWYLTGFEGGAGARSFLSILDERGAPLWYQPTNLFPINAQRLSDGTIMYDPAEANGYGVGAAETAKIISLDGTVVDEVTTDDPVAFPLDHHEHIERPGGWTLLSYPLIAGQDLSVLGPAFCTTENAVGATIREVADNGTLEWAWDTSDHFDIAEVQFPQRFQNYPAPPDRGCPGADPAVYPGEVDLFHLNSVDRLAGVGGGDYVVSARHLDAVFRINRTADADFAEGEVEWILSSAPATGPVVPNKGGAIRLEVLNDPLGGPRRPHDARLDGNVLTLFDNRTLLAGPARAVAYEIDTAAGTATLLWQIDEPLGRSSFGLGAVRVAADGSRSVTWGGLQPVFNEFDADGNLLLSIQKGPIGNAYRVVKYGPDAFDAAELRSTASSDFVP